jgi:molybdenum cofactor biosynthesis enzyme MoaA
MSLTTNGIGLKRTAKALKAAGLDRVNDFSKSKNNFYFKQREYVRFFFSLNLINRLLRPFIS